MNFLNQLKSQANALKSDRSAEQNLFEINTRLTEAASKTSWLYVSDLVKQLNVIGPAGPKLGLDAKTPWPAMKLVDFRVDARKKMLRDQEVFDYIAMGWRIVPFQGAVVSGSVSAYFPPEVQRIEARLSAGAVRCDRVDVRHPERNSLQSIRFDYVTEARGNVTITPDHDAARLTFRLAGVQGFEVVHTTYAAQQIQSFVLDELAKLIVGQTTRFI